jgi:hypothetical protein
VAGVGRPEYEAVIPRRITNARMLAGIVKQLGMERGCDASFDNDHPVAGLRGCAGRDDRRWRDLRGSLLESRRD